MCIEWLRSHDPRRNDTSDAPAQSATPLTSFLDALHYAGTARDIGQGITTLMLFPQPGTQGLRSVHTQYVKDAQEGGLGEAQAPATLAALLNDVALPDVTTPYLLSAVSQAANTMHLWGQPPRGEEKFTASLAVSGALERIADHLLRAPAARFLSQPYDPTNQWHMVPVDSETDTLPRAALIARDNDIVSVLAQEALDHREEEQRSVRELARHPQHVTSGRWWSSPSNELPATSMAVSEYGPWTLHCVEDSFGEDAKEVRQVTPPTARVKEIHTAADWAQLCALYPQDVSATMAGCWKHNTGRDGAWVTPNWLSMSQDWDAVYLTPLAYLHLTGIVIDIPDMPASGQWASSITGWSPGLTVWFVPFASHEKTAHTWRLDDDALPGLYMP